MIISMQSELQNKQAIITNFLILHIRKTYENGGDIADMIENQDLQFQLICTQTQDIGKC